MSDSTDTRVCSECTGGIIDSSDGPATCSECLGTGDADHGGA